MKKVWLVESVHSHDSPKKFGFSSIFLEWIEDVLKNQESCVINAGTTRAYFELQKGVRQGDPFLFKADIFILASEVLFNLIKTNNKKKSSNIFVNIPFYI